MLSARIRKLVMDIIFIGAQGSGKGTQAEILAQQLGVRHIASGDLFREAMHTETPLGVRARSYISRGELVPDEVTVAMILDRISQDDCRAGAILDGFPRTVAQAIALDQALAEHGRTVDRVIYLKVSRDTLLQRLSGRFICRAHQHVYNIVSNPPKRPGICDIDGSPLYQRDDDRGEAVQKRLGIFFNETIRLLDYYNQAGKVLEIDGERPIEIVSASILQALGVKART
jgi:adenylate kinase